MMTTSGEERLRETPDEAWAALWQAVGGEDPHYSGIDLRKRVEAALAAAATQTGAEGPAGLRDAAMRFVYCAAPGTDDENHRADIKAALRSGGEGPATLREAMTKAWRLDGYPPMPFPDSVYEATLAALAAAPTQTGAEGPALRDALAPVIAFLRGVAKTNEAANGIIAYIEQDAAALRSGAEVAAAEGLDVEALALALHPTSGACGPDSTGCRFRHRIHASHVAAEYARLTAKP